MLDVNSKICQSKDIDATELNEEKVMMNLDKGRYFALNSVGSRIWDIVENEICVSEIINILLNEYDIDKESCEKSVINYLRRLKDAELITVD
ncbi:lasso peptide biosynthesis PqqD family chaperone [Clostridium sp. C2-6-12]|uniref:lasso peptide biosynthesis PqqD family chaperone n=1 Tax=Clostridium sp. C2-6-12 TaxID=2698832 RepID=UPI00136B1938|nr:lasso peptide biosynthesis PqqD family chaperone [Clostridium sp. C2-6-12]